MNALIINKQNEKLENLLMNFDFVTAQYAMNKISNIINFKKYINNDDFDTDFFNYMNDNNIVYHKDAENIANDDLNDVDLDIKMGEKETASIEKVPTEIKWVEENNDYNFVPVSKKAVKAFIYFLISLNIKISKDM